MLANAAITARPGILVRRPAPLTDAAPARPSAYIVKPRAPWSRHHLSFRGTRIFTSLMLGWAGLILVAFGVFAVPAANDLGRAGADAGLMDLLGSVAPMLWGLGIVHLVAAVGIARDRRTWGFRLATWMVAVGVLVVAAGLVFALAGRDPFALADPGAGGIGLLAWTLGLYGLVGWGIRRIVSAHLI